MCACIIIKHIFKNNDLVAINKITDSKNDNSGTNFVLFEQVSVHTSALLAVRRSPSAAHSSHTGAKSTGSTSNTPTRSAGTSCTCARIVVTRPLTPDNISFT